MKYIILSFCLIGCGSHVTLHMENPGDPCIGPHNHADEDGDSHDERNFGNMMIVAGTHPEQTESYFNHKQVFDNNNPHKYEVELSDED